jgi:hypothetical protein
MQLPTQFITDEHGNKKAVILSLQSYQKILEIIEEFEAIQAYDAAKEHSDEVIPFAQAMQEIKAQRDDL